MAKSPDTPLPPSGEDACARANCGRAPVVTVTFHRAKTRHAVLTEQADLRTRMRVPARPLCRSLELFRPSCQELGSVKIGRAEEGGKGLTARFHWWSLFVDPALRSTSGKERKGRAGGGGAKMAAPLRIQSDWAQALR